MNIDYIKISNFYDDPEKIRNEALSAVYETGSDFNYPGRDNISQDTYNYKALEIVKLLGQPLIPIATGKFRSSLHDDKAIRHIHTDSLCYTTIVSLTKDDNPHGKVQTALWRHKETGALGVDNGNYMNHDYNWEAIIRDEGINEDLWEIDKIITINFNEALIINGSLFHSPVPQGFGDNLENSRLTQNFFFNKILGAM